MASRSALDVPIPAEKHHTVTGYIYYRCRCDLCRRAWTQYRASRRAVGKDLNPNIVMSRPLRAIRRQQRERDAAIRRDERRFDALTSGHLLWLDAPYGDGGSRHDRISTGDEWDDPTFDAVTERLDSEHQRARDATHAWNLDHRLRRFSMDTTDFVRAPSSQGGFRDSMASRHRGRAARAAAAAGKRSSSTQSKTRR